MYHLFQNSFGKVIKTLKIKQAAQYICTYIIYGTWGYEKGWSAYSENQSKGVSAIVRSLDVPQKGQYNSGEKESQVNVDIKVAEESVH